MYSPYIDILGYFAAFLTTASFLPQAIKVWRDDNTAAISLTMYSMFVVGIVFWTIYGSLLGSLPIVIANIITLMLALSILYKKVRHVMAGEKIAPYSPEE